MDVAPKEVNHIHIELVYNRFLFVIFFSVSEQFSFVTPGHVKEIR